MDNKRTVQETINYFRMLAAEFSKNAAREEDKIKAAAYDAKADAYEIAAFELVHNMKW